MISWRSYRRPRYCRPDCCIEKGRTGPAFERRSDIKNEIKDRLIKSRSFLIKPLYSGNFFDFIQFVEGF